MSSMTYKDKKTQNLRSPYRNEWQNATEKS